LPDDGAKLQTEFSPERPMASEEIISLSDFKADAAGWIERLQTQPPVVLTQNGRGRAVVQSYEEYERTRAELALLNRLNRALVEDQAGGSRDHADVAARAKAGLERR
jgi:prevent-host-death family protein